MLPINLIPRLQAIKERLNNPKPMLGSEFKTLVLSLADNEKDRKVLTKSLSNIKDFEIIKQERIDKLKRKLKPLFELI